jgi:hypothetical protein
MSSAAIVDRLEEMSKSDLVRSLASYKSRAASLAKNHKEFFKRAGLVAGCSAVAATTGAMFGVLETKVHSIPKTKLRIDVTLGTVIALGNALGMADELLPVFQSSADAMIGHGFGRYAEALAVRHGVTRSAPEFAL